MNAARLTPAEGLEDDNLGHKHRLLPQFTNLRPGAVFQAIFPSPRTTTNSARDAALRGAANNLLSIPFNLTSGSRRPSDLATSHAAP